MKGFSKAVQGRDVPDHGMTPRLIVIAQVITDDLSKGPQAPHRPESTHISQLIHLVDLFGVGLILFVWSKTGPPQPNISLADQPVQL